MTSSLLHRQLRSSSSPSGRFTAPDRSRCVRLNTVSSKVVVTRPIDAGIERNDGKKLWYFRWLFPIPAMKAVKTGGSSFAWVRRVCLWSWFVKWTHEEGDSKRRKSSSSVGLFRFRPRRWVNLVSLASSWRGEHEGGLSLSNRWGERENRSSKASWFSGKFLCFPATPAADSFKWGINLYPLGEFYMFQCLNSSFGWSLESW